MWKLLRVPADKGSNLNPFMGWRLPGEPLGNWGSIGICGDLGGEYPTATCVR